MMYLVERTLMSRNPQWAANSACLIIGEVIGKRFDHAQEAVDFARQWVADFDGSDIPEKHQAFYNAGDLPSASVAAIDYRRGTRHRPRIVLTVFKNMAGDIVEHRCERAK